MGIGMSELIVILVIIMIIFGAGKLPDIGSAFGKSIRNFKQSMKESEAESAGTAKAEEVAQNTNTQSVKASAKKEEDLIDEMAKELSKNRIDVIKTRHDGLVQDRDVFTESVKKMPFGLK